MALVESHYEYALGVVAIGEEPRRVTARVHQLCQGDLWPREQVDYCRLGIVLLGDSLRDIQITKTQVHKIALATLEQIDNIPKQLHLFTLIYKNSWEGSGGSTNRAEDLIGSRDR